MRKQLNVMMIGIVTIAMTACGSSTGVRKHNVGLQFGTYTTAKNGRLEILEALFLPRAYASVSSLKFCFKRLRFKKADDVTADPAISEDNIDFAIGEVIVSNASTSLGQIRLPEGEYRRVEFDLEDSCGTGNSIQLVNTNGTYATNQRVTIKFSGVFTADSDGVLNLGVQSILTQLNTYSGVGTLKDSAEAASGILSN